MLKTEPIDFILKGPLDRLLHLSIKRRRLEKVALVMAICPGGSDCFMECPGDATRLQHNQIYYNAICDYA